MSETITPNAYAEIGTRIEVEQRGHNTFLACKFCDEPLHEHEKERVYPDNGPAGTYHYRYRCEDGYVPELAREVDT